MLVGYQVEFNNKNCVGYGKCGSVAAADGSDEPPSPAATQLTCL